MRASAKHPHPRRRSAKKTTTSTPARRGQKPNVGETRARTRLDVDERRAQLVELGLAEFGTRTYDEVSIDLIAQTAGISKGLLYHYFPTKRAFYLACVREACSRLVERMDVPSEGTPLEQLRDGLDRYLDYVRGHGRAFATLMRSGVGADREITEVIDTTRSTLLGRLTSGMAEIFPIAGGALASPLMQIALHGWIGLVEAASIAWVEQCVEAEARTSSSRASTRREVAAKTDVRDLLAKTLVAIVQNAMST